MMRYSSLTDQSLDPSVQADEEAVMQAFLTGTLVDPEVVYRVQEGGRRIREEVFRRHGLVDIAVPAIRELRGPLP
ncbi:MAG TPA: hypothetical protein DDY78_18845 [Planctomycetales bacterium]|jgi:hypothetical protein|nr:hypothetical protein [Planctomycetales bacterium]